MIKFIGNSATFGGAIYCFNSSYSIGSTSFVGNRAEETGGAVMMEQCKVLHHNINMMGNLKSAMHIHGSNARFSGKTNISGNRGEKGGGIMAKLSNLSFKGQTIFEENNVTSEGGAILGIFQMRLNFASFKHNTASSKGGAILVSAADIILSGSVLFELNTADRGGAMYFRDEATLTLQKDTNLTTSRNNAVKQGGVILHEDILPQCKFDMSEATSRREKIEGLPGCFLNFNGIESEGEPPYQITSTNDSAGTGGSFLFGGLMDRCRVMVNQNRNTKT